MDFVADNLFDGRKLRMLTVVYCYSRESLAIHVGQSLKGEDVVRVLNAMVRQRGKPQTIKSDNGSEFISKAMDRWANERGVELDFIKPGKPTDNAMVESFNGRLRQEFFGRTLVHEPGRRRGPDRGMEKALSRGQAAQCARLARTERIRSTDRASARSVEEPGTGNSNF